MFGKFDFNPISMLMFFAAIINLVVLLTLIFNGCQLEPVALARDKAKYDLGEREIGFQYTLGGPADAGSYEDSGSTLDSGDDGFDSGQDGDYNVGDDSGSLNDAGSSEDSDIVGNDAGVLNGDSDIDSSSDSDSESCDFFDSDSDSDRKPKKRRRK